MGKLGAHQQHQHASVHGTVHQHTLEGGASGGASNGASEDAAHQLVRHRAGEQSHHKCCYKRSSVLERNAAVAARHAQAREQIKDSGVHKQAHGGRASAGASQRADETAQQLVGQAIGLGKIDEHEKCSTSQGNHELLLQTGHFFFVRVFFVGCETNVKDFFF